MGGGSESKKQLGKILLQQRVVSAEELQEQQRERESVAESSTRRDRGPVFEALAALTAEHSLPSVDLSERVIPLSLLKLVPVEMARERLVMPFSLDGDCLNVALTRAGDADLLEELAFVAGKTIEAHVSIERMVSQVIEHLRSSRLGEGHDVRVPLLVGLTAAALGYHLPPRLSI